ncbi:hypothetical protein HDZ31DRAFT_43183 [Schizophyllum fasciatum]
MWRAFSLRSKKSPSQERHGWPGAPYDYRLATASAAQPAAPTAIQPAPMPVQHISPPTTVPPVVSTSPPAITCASSRTAAAPQSILRTSSRAAPPTMTTGASVAVTHTVQPSYTHPPASHTPHPPASHTVPATSPTTLPIARSSSRAAAPPVGAHTMHSAGSSPTYHAYAERQDLPYTEWQAALVDREAVDLRKSYYDSSPVVAVAGSEETYDTRSITDSACSIDDRQAYPYDTYGERSTIYDSPISYSPSDTISPLSSPFDPRAAASPADSTVVLRGALPPTRTYSGRPLGFIPLELEEYNSGDDDRASYSDESFSDARSASSDEGRRGRPGDRREDYDLRRASYATTDDSYSDEAYDRRSGGDHDGYGNHALTMRRRRGRDVAEEMQRHPSRAEVGREGRGRRHGSRARHGRGFEDDRYSILEEPPAIPPRAQEPLHALLTHEPPRGLRSRKASAPPAPLARSPSVSSPVDDATRVPQPRTRRASVVGANLHGATSSSWRHSAIPTRREPALGSVPERRQSPPTVRHEDTPHVFGPRSRRSSSAAAAPPDRRSMSYTPMPGRAGSDTSGSTASSRTLATPPPPMEAPVVSLAEARTRKPSFIRPQVPLMPMPIPPLIRERSESPRDRRTSTSHRDRRDSVSASLRDRRDSTPTSPRDQRMASLTVREPINIPPNHRVGTNAISRRPSTSSPIRPSAASPVRHSHPAPIYPPEPAHAPPAEYRESRQRNSRRFSDTDAPAPRSSSPDPLPVPPPSNRRRHSDGEQTPTDGFRGVKWREGLVLPSPILTRDRRRGWYNRKGDQLWTNEGAYRPVLPGEEYPPDLDGYPDAGEGWMNEEGKRIDMQHRLVPKPPLRSVLKTNSGSLL